MPDEDGKLSYHRHPAALVETDDVGPRTRVWAFAHILPGARVGADCNICDGVFVEGGAILGDRVTVKCGVQVWDGVVLEDDVFVGPNATFTNDPFPRSRHPPKQFSRTVVRHGASIGANATILCGVTVGPWAMVGAGSVVAHDVPSNAIVVGNPAYVQGYVDVQKPAAGPAAAVPSGADVESLGVGSVTLYRLPEFQDLRGSLVVGEVLRHVPFEPKRFFVVHDVPSRQVRGEHAHRLLHQFLVCLKGQCAVLVDDGRARRELILDSPAAGLYVPPLIWATQYKFSPDAMLLVLASDHYDPASYVRNYEEFQRLVPASPSR